MGTIYYAVCFDCNLKRNLDKFDALFEVENKQQADWFAESVEGDSYRAGLVLSFLMQHAAHRCAVLSENDFLDHPDKERIQSDGDWWPRADPPPESG